MTTLRRCLAVRVDSRARGRHRARPPQTAGILRRRHRDRTPGGLARGAAGHAHRAAGVVGMSAPVPALERAFDVVVHLGPLEDHGMTRAGHRRVVPIIGGSVTGAFEAEILPGGADWQIVRSDGAIEVDAHLLGPHAGRGVGPAARDRACAAARPTCSRH